MSEAQIRFVDKTTETALIAEIGAFIKRESWGEDFPYDAANLLMNADHICAAFIDEELVGCACITRHQGCPDDYEDTHPWFCCWVVREDLRREGIGTELYTVCVAKAKQTKSNGHNYLYASTDSKKATQALTSRQSWLSFNKWQFVREGKNEDGSSMEVWRLKI